jgi:hypothetical protein
MEGAEQKKGQPFWIWALVGLAVLMFIVIAVIGAGVYWMQQGVDPLPAEPVLFGAAENALVMPNADLERLKIWPQGSGDLVDPKFKDLHLSGNVGLQAYRRPGLDRPSVVENFNFGRLNPWASRRMATLGLKAGIRGGKQTLKQGPALGRQHYDNYQLCEGEHCSGEVFLAYRGGNVYMLLLRDSQAPEDPQGLADAMDAVLDRMKAYAQEHPAGK